VWGASLNFNKASMSVSGPFANKVLPAKQKYKGPL
jgi:hypothetical protein